MLLSGKLNQYLHGFEVECYEMEELLIGGVGNSSPISDAEGRKNKVIMIKLI